MRWIRVWSLLPVLFTALAQAVVVDAQVATTGGVGGVVRDATGAVLPGVTVEASSPALIEKVRSAVTDNEGVYRILNLSPGDYTVSFNLAGFAGVRRENVAVAAGVTVNLAAELRVGSIEETITVSGGAPLVDTVNTTQARTVTRDQIEDIPAGNLWTSTVVLIPGVQSPTQDVGGTGSSSYRPALSIHGSNSAELPLLYDGMRYGAVWATGGGNAGSYFPNQATIQEIAVGTAGNTAEAEVSGVFANIIPKAGGNRYTADFYTNFSNDGMQWNNLDDELRARGVRTPDTTKLMVDVNPAVGGPIRRDKLWFFGSYRYLNMTTQPPSTFHAVDPTSFVLVRDFSRTVDNPQTTESRTVRLTWQVSKSIKASFFADDNPRCYCGNGASATTSYEATNPYHLPVNRIYQTTWNWVVSTRMLVEAGWTDRPEYYIFRLRPEVSEDIISVTDTGTGLTYRSPSNRLGHNSANYNGKVNVNYVTGSHNLKVGGQWFHGHRTQFNATNQSRTYSFLNGVPQAINLIAGPTINRDNLKLNLGLYAQEQWTRGRVTMNLGLRFDYLNGYIPDQDLPGMTFAGGPTVTPAFVGPRSFARVDNLPNWKDINPRFGVAVDIFGTGRTVAKATLSRYVEGQAVGIAERVNPMLDAAATRTTRAWTDSNSNFIPDCDLRNPALNGECGPNNNANFGRNVTASVYDPAAVTGWRSRGYNWEQSAGVWHQLMDSLSVEASYHRRVNGNFRVTDNTLVGAADYDPFCVTVPDDGRLGGLSSQSVCGLYNLSPTKFGLNNGVISPAGNFGKQRQIYNGVDLIASARLRRGVIVQGGYNVGRIETDQCFVIDSPEQLRFCNITPPYLGQFKMQGIFPLRWGLQTSVAVQSLPGPQILANWSAPAAAVTGLGRPLSGGARNVTVGLIEPGTLYGDRLNQVDFRAAKVFKVGRTQIEGQFDLFNLFNANTVLTMNNTFGANWQQPLTILPGRTAKVGLRVTY